MLPRTNLKNQMSAGFESAEETDMICHISPTLTSFGRDTCRVAVVKQYEHVEAQRKVGGKNKHIYECIANSRTPCFQKQKLGGSLNSSKCSVQPNSEVNFQTFCINKVYDRIKLDYCIY